MSISPSSFRLSRFILLAVCLALALAPAVAWPDSLQFVPGPVFRVDAPRPGVFVEGQPQAAKARNTGCTLVAWMRSGSDHRAHVIWGRQLCSSSPGPERVLVRTPGKTLTDFSLVAGGSHYALAWGVFDPVLYRWDSFVRIFNLQAVPVGPPIHIDISPTDPGEEVLVRDSPKVGIDDSGRVVVAWLEEVLTEDLNFFRVRARRYALDGTPGNEVEVDAAAGAYTVALAVAPDGSYMAGWDYYREDPAATDVRLRLYGPDDVERPVSFQPSAISGSCVRPAVESPALAASGSGFFVAFLGAVGQSPDGVNPRCIGVFAQVYDLEGGLVRDEFRVKRSSWSPIVQHNGSAFLVTWEAGPISGLPAPGGAPVPGTYAHPYGLNGYSVGPEMRVQEQQISGMAFGPSQALLVWAQNGVSARYLTAVSAEP
jgi:hypothetical protein